MIPRRELLQYPDHSSVIVLGSSPRSFAFKWHHHPEVELTWVWNSRGRYYVGDHVEAYTADHLVLLGADVPHTWAGRAAREASHPQATVLQFLPERLLGPEPLPELAPIAELISRARRGLAFGQQTLCACAAARTRLHETAGLDRLLVILDLLQRLAQADDAVPLASLAFANAQVRPHDRRMERVMRFLHKHYTEPVTLDSAAAAAAMSRSAFCRYFQRMTGKTFGSYLTELRLSHACALLRDTHDPVTDICFASGFGNLSNFNRRFRRFRGVTPLQYRRQWESPT